MANGYGIGGFASGLAEGLRTGQETRLRQELIRKRKRENRREKAIDDVRGEIADSTGEGALTTPQRALQGPTPNGEQLMSVDGAKRIQSMLTQAMLTGDENSINAVKDMGRRTAMFHVMKARQAQDPEEELASLNEAGRVIGLGDASFSRDKQGNLLDPFGNTVTPDRRPALYNYIAQQFNDPANAARMYGEDMRMDRAEGREDKRLGLAEEEITQGWARIHDNRLFEGRKLALNEREFTESVYQWEKEFGLKETEADAYSQYLLAKASLANAESEAFGAAPVWSKASDLLTAVDENTTRITNSTSDVYSEEYAQQIGAPNGEAVRNMAIELSNAALTEHGAGGVAGAEAGAQAVLGYLIGDPTAAIRDYDVDDSGRAFVTTSKGTFPISRNAVTMLMEKDIADQNAQEESGKGVFGSNLPEGQRSALGGYVPPPTGTDVGASDPWSRLMETLKSHDWKAPGEKVREYRNRTRSAVTP